MVAKKLTPKLKHLSRKLFKDKKFTNSRFSKINLGIFALIFVGLGSYLILGSRAATTCNLNATTSNFSTQLAAATAGQVLCLTTPSSSGSYSFTGTNKAITITAAPGVTVNLANFTWGSGDTAFTIDGSAAGGTMNSAGGEIDTGANNFTVRNVYFTDSLVFSAVSNSNIVLDSDHWDSNGTTFNVNSSCTSNPGRIWFPGSYTTGVTVENSTFIDPPGGIANAEDGIQTGSAVTIKNNLFKNIQDNGGCAHQDAFQSVGASHVVATGNYFVNTIDGFASFDGSSNDTITDNVCQNILSYGGGCILLYADTNSTVDHNTSADDYAMVLTAKPGFGSNGTIIRNNVGRVVIDTVAGCQCNGNFPASNTNNLFSGASSPNISGSPTYQGGSSPSTWQGFELTTGSAGHNAATDGTDVGIRASAGGYGSGGSSTPPTDSITAPSSGATVSGTVNIAATASATSPATVSNVQFQIDGSNVGSADATSPYSYSWDSTTVTNGTHNISAIVTDSTGATGSASESVNVQNTDNTPPTVSITAPSNGASLTNTPVTITANASDTGGSGLASVQFKLDGNNLGSADTTAPYSYSWSTTGLSGSHTLTAVATDGASHSTTSSPVTVTIVSSLSCSTSSTSWQNNSFTSKTTNFTFDFDSTPAANNINSVVGLNNSAAAAYTDLAAIVRFNDTGTIDAYNNTAYAAAATVPYTAGTAYHFKLTVNPTAHTYTVVVTPAGGSATTLATNYAFRSTQSTLSTFSNWALFQDPASAGSQTACNAVAATVSGGVVGDLNADGHVNVFDLSIFLTHWQQSGAGLPEDFNNDNIVNIFDLSILLSHYGA